MLLWTFSLTLDLLKPERLVKKSLNPKHKTPYPKP